MTDERGWKPPAKEAAAEERRRKNRTVLQVLNLPTEEMFIGALRVMGLMEGSPEWIDALNAWREYQRED